MVEYVIFDVDGTLVDSVDEHAEAWRRAFLEFGHDIPFAHVRSQIGKGADQLLPVFLTEDELQRFGKELDAFRSDLFKRQFMPKLRPFPRVRELFERLRAQGRRLALASSAKGDELDFYKKLCGIEGLVQGETSKDDVARSKPHADVFQAALETLGKPAPGLTAVVGDTPYDALAAGKLSLACVGVRCGGFPEDDLRAAGCRAIVDDPAELLLRAEAHPEGWPWDSPDLRLRDDEGR